MVRGYFYEKLFNLEFDGKKVKGKVLEMDFLMIFCLETLSFGKQSGKVLILLLLNCGALH